MRNLLRMKSEYLLRRRISRSISAEGMITWTSRISLWGYPWIRFSTHTLSRSPMKSNVEHLSYATRPARYWDRDRNANSPCLQGAPKLWERRDGHRMAKPVHRGWSRWVGQDVRLCCVCWGKKKKKIPSSLWGLYSHPDLLNLVLYQ